MDSETPTFPVRRVRHSPKVRAKVIAEFRRTGRIDLACAAAGCDRDCHYIWLKKDEKYATDFEAARVQVAGLMEDEAMRRATKGTLKPVSIGGQIHFVYEFSDRLLEFLLKCRNRQVFGDRQILTGENGSPLYETREQADKALEAYNQTKAPE